MKKLFSITLISLILISMLPFEAKAQTDLSFLPDKDPVVINEDFFVDLHVQSDTNNFYSADFNLQFNDSLLAYDSFTPGNGLLLGCSLYAITDIIEPDGSVTIQATRGLCPPLEMGMTKTIGHINFKALTAGTSNLSLSNVTVRSASSTVLADVTATPGSITILSAPDTTAPVRSNGAPIGTLPTGTTQTDLSLNTNENATCRYSMSAYTAYADMTETFTTTGALYHETAVLGLSSGQDYSFYVRCQDSSGNANINDYPVQFSIEAGSTVVALTPSDQTVTAGDSVIVTLEIADVGDMDNLMTDIFYDDTILSFNQAIPSALMNSLGWTVDVLPDVGFLTVLAQSDYVNMVSGDGDIVTLYFDTVSAGQTDLTYTNNLIYNAFFNEIDATWNAASVEVEGVGDTTPPAIAQVTAVPTPTNDITPNYTFSSTETGTITYGGDCTSATTNAIVGNNTITFNTLSQGTHANCTIRVTDSASNQSNVLNVNSFTIDTTLPTIMSVSSSKANGTYTVGEVIDIDVTFSENVTSTGNVTVTLETGATDRQCTFTVTDSLIGTCNYIVQAGDTSADLTVNDMAGTIRDQALNQMTNFVPSSNLAANKNIVVDTLAPIISVVASSTAATTATITWTTNEAATSQANYGLTAAYGSTTTIDSSLVTSHSVIINGLTADTIYHFRVRSKDAVNNERVSADFAFKTQTLPNNLPVMSSVTITPNPAYKTTSNLIANPNATDADGDPITYTYQWKKGGVNISGQTNQTLANANYQKDDVVTVTVTPSDGKASGSSLTSAGLIISNSLPVMTAVSITPNPAYRTTTNLTANPGATDADGDPITYAYQWKKDGVNISGQTGSTLSSANYVKNNIISVTITPNDGAANGTATTSAGLTISNSAPTQPAVSLTNPAYDSTNLICTPSGATDADSDSITYIYAWQKNNVTQAGLTANTVNASNTGAGETWKCVATPNDGTVNGPSGENSVIIQADLDTTPPTITAIASSTAATTATITWTTNEAATSQLNYGLTSSYGSTTTIDANLVTSHTVVLNGLTADTIYHFRVRSKDAAGNERLSSDYTFKTQALPPDTTPPVRDNGSPAGSLAANTTGASLSLTTDENAECRFSDISGSSYASMTPMSVTGSTTHTQDISGLTNGSGYNYYIKCRDLADNINPDDLIINFSVANPAPSGGGGGGGGGSITPPKPVVTDTTYANKPADVLASRTSTSTTLTWDNPTDSNFSRIIIIKSTDVLNSYMTFEALKSLGTIVYEGTAESYNDNVIAPNLTYYYALVAVDKNSRYSAPVIIQKLATMPSQNTDNGNDTPNTLPSGERPKNLGGLPSSEVEMISREEAIAVFEYNKYVNLNDTTRRLYSLIIGKAPHALTEQDKFALAYFIHEGTPTTIILGAGERTGVLNSYLAAFGKLPRAENEWQDIIKISNGRWPTARSVSAENNAKSKLFIIVYKRNPDMAEAHDNAAVTVIAYGLRPALRNLNSEQAAIKIFKAIFKYTPNSAIDWDIVRAIAYSGAVR